MPHLAPRPDAPTPTETAVIVAVPESEPLVGDARCRYDASAVRGVPAHVTVVYPFVPPDRVDADVLDRLGAAVATVRPFACAFAATRWFGDDVLWLGPEPADGFRALTAAVWRAFVDHPPYQGRYDDVTPHLTVAHAPADLDAMRAVEREVRDQLPLPAYVDRVLLVAGSPAPDSWREVHRFALGRAPTRRFSGPTTRRLDGSQG